MVCHIGAPFPPDLSNARVHHAASCRGDRGCGNDRGRSGSGRISLHINCVHFPECFPESSRKRSGEVGRAPARPHFSSITCWCSADIRTFSLSQELRDPGLAPAHCAVRGLL
ncbi:hypothetical protein AAFF_G00379460 [Aldrovandia affinis]|uniref:Uncharacterized protein n=1 Tax=Aldrovandia affinis TaxID=143900 RepID=A0AAD7SFR2_9TELE|nr:hypothetical protein AAFF_G00379460 [Aldrovandia affinis]